ncbi:MAG: hypothetical protein Q7U97_13290 [Rhodocyclaceae bacterium]|nr:hypothetical protein [Rhodocyclaceae bacterium]
MDYEEGLRKLSAAAIHATTIFTKLHIESRTAAGPLGDAMVIDCLASQQRIVLMLNGMDVMAGIGKKDTDNIEMLDKFPLDDHAASAIIKIMEKRFELRPAA